MRAGRSASFSELRSHATTTARADDLAPGSASGNGAIRPPRCLECRHQRLDSAAVFACVADEDVVHPTGPRLRHPYGECAMASGTRFYQPTAGVAPTEPPEIADATRRSGRRGAYQPIGRCQLRCSRRDAPRIAYFSRGSALGGNRARPRSRTPARAGWHGAGQHPIAPSNCPRNQGPGWAQAEPAPDLSPRRAPLPRFEVPEGAPGDCPASRPVRTVGQAVTWRGM
jgi:hypothetical protein